MTGDVSEFHVCPVLGVWQVSKEEHFFLVILINVSNATFFCVSILSSLFKSYDLRSP